MAYSDVVLAHSPLTLSASVDLPRSCWSSPPFLDSKNQEARWIHGITLLLFHEKNLVVDIFEVVRVSRFEMLLGKFNLSKIRTWMTLQLRAELLFVSPRVVVYLSLCDDEAAMFRGLINSGDRSQSVMVVTTVNPKIFGGTLYFTTATKLYFYPALQAIAEFTARYNSLCFNFYGWANIQFCGCLNQWSSNFQDQWSWIFWGRMWGEASGTARNKVRGEYKEPSPTTLGGKKNILKRPCEWS